MLQFNNEYYLYRHIREDTNEVFYVGIGKGKCYTRSKSKSNRNDHWHHIVAKTGYSIQIIMDAIPKEIAEEKEKEFIKLYGRRDLGLGTLVNLTDGGYGKGKYIAKSTTRKKLSIAATGVPNCRKGVKASPETCLRIGAAKFGNKYWVGRRHSEETKIKIGLSSKGRPGYWKDKNLSDLSKEKISIKNSGNTWSEDHKISHSLRMTGTSNSMFGKKHTDESKAKMAETKRLRKCL